MNGRLNEFIVPVLVFKKSFTALSFLAHKSTDFIVLVGAKSGFKVIEWDLPLNFNRGAFKIHYQWLKECEK